MHPTIALPDYHTLEREQRERLAVVRSRRDAGDVRQRLDAIRIAAAGTAPLMNPIIDAVRARATLGEISDTMRGVWGTYRGEGAA